MSGVLRLLSRLKAGEGSCIIGYERCDCGEQIRHCNGGNYHRKAWVIVYSDGFSVTLGDTRDLFSSDEVVDCDCGRWFRADEIHLHETDAEKVAQILVDYIKEGSIVLYGQVGEYSWWEIDAVEIS